MAKKKTKTGTDTVFKCRRLLAAPLGFFALISVEPTAVPTKSAGTSKPSFVFSPVDGPIESNAIPNGNTSQGQCSLRRNKAERSIRLAGINLYKRGTGDGDGGGEGGRGSDRRVKRKTKLNRWHFIDQSLSELT